MFELKFNQNKLTENELKHIEKLYKQFQNEKITAEFNVLELSRIDLYSHLLNLFVRLDIHTIIHVNVSQLLDFFIDVADKYTNEAPYHTFYHAVDVVTMLYYICRDLDGDKYLTDLDVTYLMVAALCHDAGHPGSSNVFQLNTNTELAKKYKDTSILEMYSVDLTLQLLEKHDIRHDNMKSVITDLILSTDMINHQKLEKESKQLDTTWKTHSFEDRQSLCRILLHAADISNMTRPWKISKQWSDLIVQEFFDQGDKERRLKMTISPGMDRHACTQKTISLKFNAFILPYFQSLIRLIPKSHVLVDHLASNRIQWECPESTNLGKRRISSDIRTPTTSITPYIPYKRIRLGIRSQSFPTVLYHPPIVVEKSNLSQVTFRPSFMYEKSNHLDSIVLYHPLES